LSVRPPTTVAPLGDRMTRLALALTLAATTAITTPGIARGQVRGPDSVPPGHAPPPGMCRIWIDGVPAGQQPAPTDCATAVRNRPANGRVIFGDDTGKKKPKGTLPGVASFGAADAPPTWGRLRRARPSDERSAERDQRDPLALPAMVAAVQARQGRRTADVARWLGDRAVVARYDDVDRNGLPVRVQWLDHDGALVQLWIDRNGDGRADRVELFESGRRVRVVEP
jgi:hypothetical protein